MGKDEDNGSSLMKMVEAIAISPQDARVVAEQYQAQARKRYPGHTDEEIVRIVSDKIIGRYSKLAASTGAATAVPGAIPGIGTAISIIGGGLVDVSACMKLQIDMTMCLAMAINGKLSNEDAKHMSYIIALSGSLEQMTSSGATKLASVAGVRMVKRYLTGGTLVAIKEMFKAVGIKFTQKAAVKVVPFGVGIIVGGSGNYMLTRYVGRTARDMFMLDLAGSADQEVSEQAVAVG